MMQAHNVLVVENDRLSLRLYQRVFLMRGYDVFAVTSTEEALLLLGDRDFAVMLYNMEFNGSRSIDFLCHVHAHLQAVGTTVIAMYGQNDTRSECEALDGVYMLHKKDSVRALGNLVDHLISMEPAAFRDDDPTQPSRSAFLRAARKSYVVTTHG